MRWQEGRRSQNIEDRRPPAPREVYDLQGFKANLYSSTKMIDQPVITIVDPVGINTYLVTNDNSTRAFENETGFTIKIACPEYRKDVEETNLLGFLGLNKPKAEVYANGASYAITMESAIAQEAQTLKKHGVDISNLADDAIVCKADIFLNVYNQISANKLISSR